MKLVSLGLCLDWFSNSQFCLLWRNLSVMASVDEEQTVGSVHFVVNISFRS